MADQLAVYTYLLDTLLTHKFHGLVVSLTHREFNRFLTKSNYFPFFSLFLTYLLYRYPIMVRRQRLEIRVRVLITLNAELHLVINAVDIGLLDRAYVTNLVKGLITTLDTYTSYVLLMLELNVVKRKDLIGLENDEVIFIRVLLLLAHHVIL